MEDKSEITVAERDAATAAMLNVQEARKALETHNISRADAALCIAQGQLIDVGAKDVGSIPLPRDLNDNWHAKIQTKDETIDDLEEKISRKQEKIDELEKKVENLKEQI